MPDVDKEKSIKLIGQLLKEANMPFRSKKNNEDGGIFLIKNGERTKFTENIFAIRSIPSENN